ncbi:hypothetical protein, partial [Sedimentimonas flavescens]|uniref:hypothetical protein n=1 Tax=Sedimentimonas flavescens TaxID=2851012 RepID=UPI001C4A2F36
MALEDNNDVILSDDQILDDGLAVSTDKDDYAPGSTAFFTASGLEDGASVTFEVEHVSDAGEDGVLGTADDVVIDLGGDGHDSWTVTDGGDGDLDGLANGTVVTSWYVNPDDSAGERFLVSASSGSDTAYATFTDGIGDDAGADVDLTGPAPTTVELDGALFSNDAAGAGTGLINPFVRISTNDPVEEGYNTSDRPLDYDENSSPNFTRDLFYGDIPVVTLYDDEGNAVQYLEFRLDINEPDSGATSYLSLDEVQIYLSNEQVPSGDPGLVDLSDYELVWSLDELDANGEILVDNWIALDYTLQAGSGVSDMIMYVPLSSFEEANFDLNDGTYVTLYSKFGDQDDYVVDGELVADWTNNSGFEEWSVRQFVEVVGIKFNDIDSDGVQDDGEEVMSGWEIRAYIDLDRDGLLDQNEYELGAYATDFTNEFGEFELNFFLDAQIPNNGGHVADAQFIIVEVMQDGWEQGSGGASVLDPSLDTGSEELGPLGYVYDPVKNDLNKTLDGFDFGNYEPTGNITGEKYNDVAGDGAGGTDTPIAGWTIYLFDDTIDTDNSGGLSEAEISAALSTGTPVATTVTNGSGVYYFGDVMVGDYFVIEDMDGPDGNWMPTTTPWHAVTVVGGETFGDEGGEASDFANFEKFDISGTKYTDITGDGLSDDDTGLGGVTIFIDVNGNGLNDDGYSVVTANGTTDDLDGDGVIDDEGFWTFLDLDYTVAGKEIKEITPSGYVQTVGQVGTITDTSATHVITGTSGADQTGLDFANFEKFDISGTKYTDITGDGLSD